MEWYLWVLIAVWGTNALFWMTCFFLMMLIIRIDEWWIPVTLMVVSPVIGPFLTIGWLRDVWKIHYAKTSA